MLWGYFGITVDRGWARGAIGWIEVGGFVDFCLLFDLGTFGSLSGFWRVARVRGVYRNALHFDPRFECVGLVFSLLDGVLWGVILGLRLRGGFSLWRWVLWGFFGITVDKGWARGAIG